MIRINRILTIFLLLMPLAPLLISSCGVEQKKIEIPLELDYSGLLAAIRDSDKSLSDYLTMIENSLEDGLTDNQEAMALIQELIASMEGSMEQKLEAITAAMKQQTTSLETKLALIEEAVNSGFADSDAQQELLQQAIKALEGTMEEKLEAIEAAVKSQQASLETKIGLIEAVVAGGFADSAAAEALMLEAIETAGSTLEERAAKVEAAIENQSTDLSAKLALIDAAVAGGFAGQKTVRDLVRKAVSSLGGTLAERFSAIEAAVKSQTSSLEAKLALVEAAADAGTTSADSKLLLIQQALSSMGGTMQQKLDAILDAVSDDSTTLDTKVGLISSAVESGFLSNSQAVQAMQTALNTSLGTLDQDMTALKTDVLNQLTTISQEVTPTELAKAFQGILGALDSQNQSANVLLAAIQQAISDLMEKAGNKQYPEGLVYMGNPLETIAVTCGNTIEIPIRVNPSNVPLIINTLSVVQVEDNQFFLSGTDRSKAVKKHYKLSGLEKDPQAEGQYIVKLQTLADEMYKYWDEATLTIDYSYLDKDHNVKTVSTQPIPIAIMPNPIDGLSFSGCEKTASFLIDKEPGIIYQPLNSVEFTDGQQTRTYSAEFLTSVVLNLDSHIKVKTIFDKDRHFVGIVPDTTDSAWLPLFDSTTVNHQEILGYLELTDRFGGNTDKKNHALTGLTWYTSYIDTVLANTAFSGNGALQVNLVSKATELGLNLNDYPGSTFCSVHFDFASAGGVWRSAAFKSDSWDLEMELEKYPSGSHFTVDAVITQTVQPSDNNPSFRPKQRKVRIRVNFTVK